MKSSENSYEKVQKLLAEFQDKLKKLQDEDSENYDKLKPDIKTDPLTEVSADRAWLTHIELLPKSEADKVKENIKNKLFPILEKYNELKNEDNTGKNILSELKNLSA